VRVAARAHIGLSYRARCRRPGTLAGAQLLVTSDWAGASHDLIDFLNRQNPPPTAVRSTRSGSMSTPT